MAAPPESSLWVLDPSQLLAQGLDFLPSLFGLLCRSPIVWLIQLQSCLICLGLGIAWWYASWCRIRELKRINDSESRGNSMAFINPDMEALSHQRQKSLPKVTVILAVKGVGEQGLTNWRSQLITLYGGPLEFLFCMESKLDPAFDAVTALKKEMANVAEIRLVVAGLSSHCSQQIHNQLAGARSASPDSKYTLFLDDDIQCHPGTIGSLVEAMEAQPDIFVATGYSFDLPSQPSLAAYAAMAYRLPLLIGMSSGAQVFFVWGGCIFFRTDDFRNNKHGMKTALEQNGYSNDLILTSIAGLNKRKVWSPAVAVFPGKMSGDWTLTRYWNYVRRQIFALLTYCSPYAYRVNRTGWLAYMYLSWACILPLILSFLQLVVWISTLTWHLLEWIDRPQFQSPDPFTVASIVRWAVAESVSQQGLAVSCANLACAAVVTVLGVRLFAAIIGLCNKLSPEAPKFQLENISLLLSVAGMVLNLAMLPVIAMYTYIRADISWARIRYVRRNGIVAKVTHPGEEKDVGYREAAQLPPGVGVIMAKIMSTVATGGNIFHIRGGQSMSCFDLLKSWVQRFRRRKVG